MAVKPLDVLVVGGGMYVTGRGADGYHGTIMPALLEARRAGLVGRIGVVTTSAATAGAAADTVRDLADRMGVDPDCQAFPESDGGGAPAVAAQAAFKPDAVIVSVPDHLHAETCVPLIEAGCHCLVVKPMAGTLADARAMAEAAARAEVVAQVEFHKRHDESNLLLRQAVRGGDLGNPLYATVEYSQRKMVPRDAFRSWAEKSNIFQYLGVHYVDLIGWATGFSPRRVSAWGQKDYLAKLGIDTWDSMQVVIEWDRGDGTPFVSTHVTNWIDPDTTSAMSDQKICIVGTAGRYQADQKHRGVESVSEAAGVRQLNPYFTADWRDDVTDALTFHGYGIKSVHQFLADVSAYRAGQVGLDVLTAARPSFAGCVAGTAVVEAARKSLENNSQGIDVQT